MRIILENNSELKEKLNFISSYFGYKEQYNKLIEEIKEFKEAEKLSDNELEEMCDIWVVLSGILDGNEKAEEIIEHKIDRTIKRIEEGYY